MLKNEENYHNLDHTPFRWMTANSSCKWVKLLYTLHSVASVHEYGSNSFLRKGAQTIIYEQLGSFAGSSNSFTSAHYIVGFYGCMCFLQFSWYPSAQETIPTLSGPFCNHMEIKEEKEFLKASLSEHRVKFHLQLGYSLLASGCLSWALASFFFSFFSHNTYVHTHSITKERRHWQTIAV